MAKEESKTVSARVYCKKCGSRYVTNVELIGPFKKDAVTSTPCPKCKSENISSMLKILRKY